MYELKLSQIQMITFVLVDAANAEVTGLGNAFTVAISKAGGAFAASTGTKAEIGLGWYRYTTTAAETNTPGPLAFTITAAGCAQQNLEYIVVDRAVSAIDYTYTVTSSVTLLPIEGVTVWVTIDVAGTSTVWSGTTDATGVARDLSGNKPRLDAGTYYFWCEKAGVAFTNPDTEVVS
jgi:hypothetical protein